MDEIIKPFLAALVTAVAGTVTAWFLSRARSGRLTRTIEQTGKLLELVERYYRLYDEVEKSNNQASEDTLALLATILAALKEDFKDERGRFGRFRQQESVIGRLMLLYAPKKRAVWALFCLFYFCIVFVVFVLLTRATQHYLAVGRPWGYDDTIAITAAFVLGLLVRMIVMAVS